ncbi:MAG: right-handed parallel beta-helix repeat-containing protein, partial [bacterium]
NCVVRDNLAGNAGGVYCGASSATFTNCTLSGNVADNYGGGLVCDGYSAATFKNCVISGNMADRNGGGLFCYYASPTFTNCTMSGNEAGSLGGGGVICDYSSPAFRSIIIAFSIGSGIWFRGSTNCTMEYCDISGNSGANIQFRDNDPSQGPACIGQLVTANENGDSCDVYFNIFLDPLFADTAADDFHLTDFSP